jgi:hypothetical protein
VSGLEVDATHEVSLAGVFADADNDSLTLSARSSNDAVATAAQPERHLEASRPGDLVQFDCFHVGRLSGTRGAGWQYTAIDSLPLA